MDWSEVRGADKYYVIKRGYIHCVEGALAHNPGGQMLRDKEENDAFCRRRHGQGADMRRGAALKSSSRQMVVTPWKLTTPCNQLQVTVKC